MKLCRFVPVYVLFLLFPSTVLAQASIAGFVRDPSQAVLPGVTVEASSPALIEKVRGVVTDATGQYRIVDLRPGVYTVTFTLPGFSTVRREGIELTGAFAATINAEMRVGAIEETITVTGETPVVDVQTARTQQTINSAVLTAIPTARNYQNLHVLVPGVSVAAGSQDVGGAGGDQQVYFAAHGGDVRDSKLLINGLSVAAPVSNGGRTMYVPHAATSEEVSITTSGGLGEAETAGVVVNLVSKDGGNTFRGSLFGTGATEGMVSSNYDQALKDLGLRAPNKVKNVFDYEGTVGGPILTDKLWFFFNMRYNGAANWVAGMYANKNAGDPTKWNYEPDLAQPSFADQFWLSESLRLTWQVNERNKIAISGEDQLRCVGCSQNASATSSPEANQKGTTHPMNLIQAVWSSPVSNRVLLEAGASAFRHRWGSEPFPGTVNPDLIRVTEQGGLIPGLTYRAPIGVESRSWGATYATRASITYTSGAHSMKFGYNGTYYSQSTDGNSLLGITYRFRDGVPNQLTTSAHPFSYYAHPHMGGFYAQDQWTINRLTVAGGLRYDYFTTRFPASQLGPTRFLPTALVFPEEQGADLNDITLRTSAAYDVFGDGKTAVKVSLGKYVLALDNTSALQGAAAAPMARIALSTSRSWNDANRNFVPDCDLTNLAANSECGAAADQTFGKAVFTTRYDPEILRGWGVRPYNWAFDVSVQRELLPRVSANFGYFRRWFGNFVVSADQAKPASAYTFYDLPVPNDPRLPVSGVVRGFFDVNPNRFGVVDNLVTAASNYGKQTKEWDGVDLSVNARLSNVVVQGGVSTGRESRNICEVAAKYPNVLLNANVFTSVREGSGLPIPMQYCEATGKLLTQLKLLGSYSVPRIDVQFAATLQSIPGQDIQASYTAPNAVVAPLLGRNLSGNAANATLNLLPQLTYYSDRVNQLDFRAAKIFRFAGRRLQTAFDMYNALNSNVVQTYNPNYNPTGAWLVPTGILPARVIKVSAQFDF
jgi:hypothetical protein